MSVLFVITKGMLVKTDMHLTCGVMWQSTRRWW